MVAAVALVVAVGSMREAGAQPTMDVGAVVRNAGEPYTLGRESQCKVAFVDGTWWAVAPGSSGVDFLRFDPAARTWSQPTFPGSHVTNDPSSIPDVRWDGTNLLVLYSTGSGLGSLYLAAYSYTRPNFQILSGFPVHIADKVVIKEYTLVEDSNGRVWVSWASTSTNFVAGTTGTGPSGWTSFLAPLAFGNAGTGIDGDLGANALVVFGSGSTAAVGLMWTECFSPPNNHTKFVWRLDSNASLTSSAWSPVELCQEDATNTRLTDDHLSVRSFEGQVWAASKTNYGSTDDGLPRFTLMRRDLSGQWSHWTSKTITGTDYSTRPICVIDAANRLVWTLWHNLGIQYDTTPIDSPGTFSPIQQSILPHGGGCWDCSSAPFPVNGTTGLMILADDNGDGWTYWQQFQLGSSTPTLTTITVSPNPVTIAAGGQVQFTAQGRDQNGNPIAVSPTWSASGGTITSAGLYTAGSGTGSFTATATSGGVSGSASITIPVPNQTLTTITVTPNPASVVAGGQVPFAAQGFDQNGSAMSVTPSWTATGGAITTSGLYTAGQVAGVFSATATSGSVSGSAQINVSAPAQQILTTIVVTPNPASTTPGGTVTFSAQGQDQNGSAMAISPAPTWSAAGGTITQSGVYTAGPTTGSFGVSATSQGITGNATVAVSSAATKVVVDNTDPGFSVVSGSWTIHFNPYRYGATDLLLNSPSAGTVQWRPAGLPAGTYDVYAWWPSRLSPAIATYKVTTTSGPVNVTVDQSPSSSWGVWNKLGTFSLDPSSVLVQESGASGQLIAADAIEVVPAGSAP